MKGFISILFFVTILTNGFSQSAHSHLREGDASYENGDFSLAEESYRKSLEEKRSLNGSYNLGNAIYNQERYDEAIKHYLDAVRSAESDEVKANAYHNLGNALYLGSQGQSQDPEVQKAKKDYLKNSIEAYKNSLRLNSEDVETKHNLSMALRQQRIQQQQQQQQQQQNQDQENQDQDQQQQQQEQQDQQENKDQQSQQGNQDIENEQQEQEEASADEKDLNKEEAEKLLQIMDEEERKVQEKMKKAQTGKSKYSKDW